MEKTKRIIALLLALSALTLSFVSCGKDKKTDIENGEPYENGEEIDGSDGEHTKLH